MRSVFRAVLALMMITAASGVCAAQKPSGVQKPKVAGSRQLATFDGVPITEKQARTESAADLDALELQTLKAKAIAVRNELEILEKALDRIIEEKLLKAESAELGISADELLAREVEQKIAEPTEKEIDDFYTQNKQRIVKPKAEVSSTIAKYLQKEQEENLRAALFNRLEKKHKVVRLLAPPRYKVSAAGRPSLGPVSAPVQLVLFSDFQCPYCKNFSETLKDVVKQYGTKVRLEFRQYPLTEIHRSARKAALAALCADAQGRFWDMHDLLFADQGNLKDEDLNSRANKLGLNAQAFKTCLDTKAYDARITEDTRAAAVAGVEGTPALFINGRFLYGSRSFEEISEIIDEELNAKK